jgi:hypothetical protein
LKLLESRAFIGQYPFDEIISALENQFSDYLNLEDRTNYVETFYRQLDSSYRLIDTSLELEDRFTIEEILEQLDWKFAQKLAQLIELRLGLGINGFIDEKLTPDELRAIYLRLYEYFIMRAKANFKAVIGTKVCQELALMGDIPDDQYFPIVEDLLDRYNPIIINVEPAEFLAMTAGTETLNLFNSGEIVGNFLLKYSPRLYQSELFQIELVNYITSRLDLGKEHQGHHAQPASVTEETAPELDEPPSADPISENEEPLAKQSETEDETDGE